MLSILKKPMKFPGIHWSQSKHAVRDCRPGISLLKSFLEENF